MSILSLYSFITEEKDIQLCSFQHDNKIFNFDGETKKDLYCQVIEWLYKNGYKFENKSIQRKLLTRTEVKGWIEKSANFIKKNISRMDLFYNIEGTDKWVVTNYIKNYQDLIFMLNDFGTKDIIFNNNKIDITKEPNTEEPNTEEQEVVNSYSRMFPSNFKASQSQEEIESKDFSKNPFIQAICVLGGSGAGKSTTIENILNKEGHKFEFIIPSASTTGLLSQFSPSKSGYVQSKLGKMIVNAYSNPTQLFTAVFDECHKSNIIEMINDEILQAISIKRNNGKRFISLDDDTAELYPGTEKSRGNILIPDNLGFIFISSNSRVISGNEDFFNRVDLVELTKESRFKNIEDIIRVEDTDKKYELVSKIMSESKR